MARAATKRRPAKLQIPGSAQATATDQDGFRIDVDLEEAARVAERVRGWLVSLRQRHHDLARFEYTRLVRIVPASATYSHPILTLGTRFAESEDHLLATYLHEQMHWYLWRLGGPDHDPVAPFFDELVRRYPKAPTRLPEGARNYEQTYIHLVVCWLELNATSEFIGWDRAAALAETNYGYRWIYRTVLRDWEPLGQLFEKHGILPMIPAGEMLKTSRKPSTPARKSAARRGAAKRRRAAKSAPPPRKSRRTPPARGGRSPG